MADFTKKQREKLADEKEAMPDGSYPIRNRSDLKNAIQAFGRSKNPEKTKAWIKKRARELDAEDLIPESWLEHMDDSAYLVHYGVMGMKWGVRKADKYQAKADRANSRSVRLKAKSAKLTTKAYRAQKKSNRLSKKISKASSEEKAAKYSSKQERVQRRIASLETRASRTSYAAAKSAMKSNKYQKKVFKIMQKSSNMTYTEMMQAMKKR